MNCPRCQHDNPAGVKFCGECGARLESVCVACGAANPPGNKFCGECGAALTQIGPTSKFASPQAYTPKHLAEKILTSKSALEGERKQVTVLFADMKGSMELLADRDPEEARKLLDPVIEHMMEAVHRYEGTVSNLMGDGIMALFGAPLAHEDHAVRACYAALRMQESVNRYADGVRRTEGVPIQIRVGLNSGEVVVGAIGNDLKMDYTAIGQTVHLAARMEQMATLGSIMMTADALSLAEGYVQVKPLGPVSVKGLIEPVEVYEVTGAGPVRSRLQAAAARGLTRFVGRAAEFDTLCQALDRARAGHGQVVALVGEPGVGKSRLFWEFTHSRRTVDWLIVESGSVSYAKATAYLPITDLLKAYFAIEDRDDVRKIREKVTGKLLTLDKSLEPALPAFLALLDVTVEDDQWQNLDPPQRRQQTLDAVKRLLLRESQVQPLVLVFEDLHWIDSETQAILDGLVESLPTARMLLLVNYRPEYQHGWGSKTYYSQIRIDPLTRESAMEILSALLGDDQALQPLKDLLIARTEGTPFYLEECVRNIGRDKRPGRNAGKLSACQTDREFPSSRLGAGGARRPHRPALPRSETIASICIGYRQRFPVCFAPCHHGSIGRRTPARTRSAAGGGVSLRDVSRSRIHFQARPHARSRLSIPASHKPPELPRVHRVATRASVSPMLSSTNLNSWRIITQKQASALRPSLSGSELVRELTSELHMPRPSVISTRDLDCSRRSQIPLSL